MILFYSILLFKKSDCLLVLRYIILARTESFHEKGELGK